jgi:hypothetical protein
MDNDGRIWTNLILLRIRRLGVRVPPSALRPVQEANPGKGDQRRPSGPDGEGQAGEARPDTRGEPRGDVGGLLRGLLDADG